MAITTAAQEIIRRFPTPGPNELPDGFWELIARYRGDLLNQALAVLGTMEDAEDAVQETFCEALRKHEELRRVDSLGAWLRSINKANALDRLRARKRRARHAEREQEGRRFVTTGGFSVLELREAVARAIETLPERSREVLVLHYWEEQGHEAIAQKLGISTRTVRRIIYEASSGALYDLLKPQLESGPNDPETKRPENQRPGKPEI